MPSSRPNPSPRLRLPLPWLAMLLVMAACLALAAAPARADEPAVEPPEPTADDDDDHHHDDQHADAAPAEPASAGQSWKDSAEGAALLERADQIVEQTRAFRGVGV